MARGRSVGYCTTRPAASMGPVGDDATGTVTSSAASTRPAGHAGTPRGRLALSAPVPAVLVLGGAALALLLGRVLPLVSPLLIGLVVGVAAANLPATAVPARGATGLGRVVLRWGIVGLGLRISVGDLASLGATGAAAVVLTVVVTFTATTWFGRRLGLDRGLVVLVAAGFSICGAAAIAAFGEVTRARQRDTGLALALVTVFGSAMILLVPAVAPLVGLDDHQAAVWAGASIHEVAQVVGAASLLGPSAVATATTVKLARVALLAPMVAFAARDSGRPTRLGVPWFVVAFLVAVVLRSTGLLAEPVLEVAGHATTFLLAAGMVGLGLGVRATDLWPLSGRAVLLAAVATTVAALVPWSVLVFSSVL